MKITEASIQDMNHVRNLFREYQQWLGIDLCFQKFDQELANLPGEYAPPGGAIFAAIEKEEFIGCVAIRPKTEYEAELKRLYVRPSSQGQGIGKQLFLAAMEKAKAVGYHSMVLDTLFSMKVAKALYLAHGFEEISAYYENPEEGVKYYRKVFS